MKLNLIQIIFFLLISQTIFAGIGDIPGTIPLEFKRPPATDLVYNGKILLPHEAIELRDLGINLEDLNPQESDIFNNTDDVVEIDPDMDELDVDHDDTVYFVSKVLSRSGNFRFSALKDLPQGKKAFTFMISKNIHNVLLRSALLRKLGYIVPPIKHIKKIRVMFDTTFEKENFINRVAEDTFGDQQRWIVENQEGGKEIVVQDLIALATDDLIYNLALGYVSSEVIKGRRALNSLLIPYSLTDSPESINLLSWHAGTVISGYVRLSYEAPQGFSTPYEDALWILKRLKRLTVEDFEEIVQFAKLPKVVGKLLKEKLIARRNSILKLFSIEHEKLPYNSKITDGEFLVDGKILKEKWDGYASRFSFGDPESPLSSGEIFAYFKSKFISNVIFNAVNLFNTKVIPTVDIQNIVIQRQMDRAVDAYRNFLLNGGTLKPEPVSVYAIPIISGNILVSREIIAGSYLGTDNVVQLADSIGISLSVGAYLGTDLVNAPWLLSGKVKAHITRNYSHIKPIKSMKKALKTSFRNILVPLQKKKIGRLLDRIVDENIEHGEIDDEERQKRLKEIMNTFKENLKIGESLMITDTIGAGFSVNGGYQFAKYLRAFMGFNGKQILLSRLHIHRKGEDTIQIYKDLGSVGSIGLHFGMNALIPIVKLGAHIDKGKSKTKFYTLDINDDLKLNPDIFKNTQALRALLVKNSLEQVKSVCDPYFLKHDFKQGGGDFSFLFLRYKGLKSKDFVTVRHPEGAKKYFYRRVTGYREGVDFQNTIIGMINALISELTGGDDISLNTPGSGNPGDTYYGKAFSRSVMFAGEVIDPTGEKWSSDGKIIKPIVNIVHRWKGWKIKKRAAKKIIKELNNKYGQALYPEHVLGQTKALELYQIKLVVTFYEKAIMNMVNLSSKEVGKYFDKYADPFRLFQASNRGGIYDAYEAISDAIRSFRHYQKKYKKWNGKNDLSKVSSYVSKMVSLVESSMNLEGMKKMAGDANGLYIYSRLEGFRVGDENGDRPFVSSSLGEIGSIQFKGPLFKMQERTGMTEAEFFGHWIQDRL